MFVNASNNAETKLISSVNSSQTSLTVDDASIFPDAPFLITVNEEIMRVTNVSGNTLTVQRAQEGTGASNHNAGSTVENNFTAGTYQALVQALEKSVLIEEQGENANGSYIRYKNGLQECWKRLEMDRRANARMGADWVFPKSFIREPLVNYTIDYRDANISPSSFNMGLQY